MMPLDHDCPRCRHYLAHTDVSHTYDNDTRDLRDQWCAILASITIPITT